MEQNAPAGATHRRGCRIASYVSYIAQLAAWCVLHAVQFDRGILESLEIVVLGSTWVVGFEGYFYAALALIAVGLIFPTRVWGWLSGTLGVALLAVTGQAAWGLTVT